MRRNPVFSAMIVFLSAMLPAFDVQAQNQMSIGIAGGSGRQSSRNIRLATTLSSLLKNEQVQKELDLSDDQKTKAAEASAESATALSKKISSLPMRLGMRKIKTETDDLIREHEDKLMKKLGEILRPRQFQRLQEIHIQSQGVMALLTPGVIKALVLTDAQQKDMKVINDEFIGKMMNTPMPAQKWDIKSENPQAKTGYGYGLKASTPETSKMQTDMKNQRDAKLLEILTQDQRDQFEKLKGKKLDIKFTSTTAIGSSVTSESLVMPDNGETTRRRD